MKTLLTILTVLSALIQPANGQESPIREKITILGAVPFNLDTAIDKSYAGRGPNSNFRETLLGPNEEGQVSLQMAQSVEISPDGLSITLTLRPNLWWHDNTAVKAEDCVASIQRWAAVDPMGKVMMRFVNSIEARSENTLVFQLKEPTNLVLRWLAKPSGAAYMMPKWQAEAPIGQSLATAKPIGSGPYMVEEWVPSQHLVLKKFEKYTPRAEPSSGMAGGKTAIAARVEWRAMSELGSMIVALKVGDGHVIEALPLDMFASFSLADRIAARVSNRQGNQIVFRLNHRSAPFDNPKVRELLWHALNQREIGLTAIGQAGEAFYRTCKSFLACGTSLSIESEDIGPLNGNLAFVDQRLKMLGYKGEPVRILSPTNLASLNDLAVKAQYLMGRKDLNGAQVGFNVEVVPMLWSRVISTRNDPKAWHGFFTNIAAIEAGDPIETIMLDASCNAFPGWPCNPEIERLRMEFARATGLEEQRKLVLRLQKLVREETPYIPLGMTEQVSAVHETASDVSWYGGIIKLWK